MSAGRPWQAAIGGPTFPRTSCLAQNNIKVATCLEFPRSPHSSFFGRLFKLLYQDYGNKSTLSQGVMLPSPTYFSHITLHSSSHSIHGNVGNDIYVMNFGSDTHYMLNDQVRVGTVREPPHHPRDIFPCPLYTLETLLSHSTCRYPPIQRLFSETYHR
jgi:hypothetical protein